MSSYYHIKSNVDLHEYNMHNYIYHLNIVNVPRPVKYDRKTKQLYMELIPSMCISDFYGEDMTKVPEEILSKIRETVKRLYENNIIYPDITGYNFIEFKEKVYIIDFEHCYFAFGAKDSYVKAFIEGTEVKEWNPDFK